MSAPAVRFGEPGRLAEVTDRCPYCGYGPLDGYAEARAAGAGGPPPGARGPADGDVTFCLDCASLLLFTAAPGGGLGVRYPSPEEVEGMRLGPEWRTIQQAHQRVSIHARRRPRPLPLPPLPPGQSVVVAELSKNWPDPDGADRDRARYLAHDFEDVIESNARRGLRLVCFQLDRMMIGPEACNETIIAVFERTEPTNPQRTAP